MRYDEIRVRALEPSDLGRLRSFRCSTGDVWEEVVEQQIHGPLPRRYLGSRPQFDGRMMIASDIDGEILAVGAHHIAPMLTPDVGYTEVIAVALSARGTLVMLETGEQASFGAFMLLTIFAQMRALGRHPRTFVRVDRRNVRSLALCDRVGLRDEAPEPDHPMLVQRWGELPAA